MNSKRVQMLWRVGKAILALVALLASVTAYLHVATQQSAVNAKVDSVDQADYLDFAKKAYETGFSYTGIRNQMPMMPFFHALFYSPDLADEDFFAQGKNRNVALSIVCLSLLGVVFFWKFSRIYALYSLLTVAFLVFAIKSPYFQAEILFYTVFGFAFILAVESIREPHWYKTLGTGILFALAHLTKASATTGLTLFIVSYVVCILVHQVQFNIERQQLYRLLLSILLPIIGFFSLLAPYLIESKQTYGSFFFNVNTTFYIWYDRWRDVRPDIPLLSDPAKWDEFPGGAGEGLPSMQRYLAEHDVSDIAARFLNGLRVMVWSGCTYAQSKFAYGYCSQVGLGFLLTGLALVAMAMRWRRVISLKNAQLTLFCSSFLLAYVLAFAWYIPISGHGSRMILSLMIPFLWTVGLLLHSNLFQSLRHEIVGLKFRWFDFVYLIMLATLVFEILQLIAYRCFSKFGGS